MKTAQNVLYEVMNVVPPSRPENDKQNIILIDWFSMTSRIDSVNDIIHLLGLDYPAVKWLTISGCHGFKTRLYFDGISIHYDGSAALGLDNIVWLEMSGQGCRAFEDYSKDPSWEDFFSLVLADPANYHLTRLDIAYDDHSGILVLSKLKSDLDHGNFVSDFRKTLIEYDPQGDDMCIYYGSKKSDMLFRCYNKAAERGRSDEIDHWVRFEIQLRDDHAREFLANYHENRSLGLTFAGVVSNSMRYVSSSKSDTNKRRWKLRRWWSQFIGDAAAISLYTPKGTDYNLFRLENYVVNNCGNAVDCYIDIFGVDHYLEQLRHRSARKNVKYDDLKNKARLADDIFASSKDLAEAYSRLESLGML